MPELNFKPGDEVKHKTGKVRMIYIGEDSMGDALCEWTAVSGEMKRDSFSHIALEKFPGTDR